MRFFTLTFATAAFFLALIFPVMALADFHSTLYYEASPEKLAVGTKFEVKVYVDSNQPLNAYSLELFYEPSKVRVIGFNNAQSIVDVFQDAPEIFEGGKIRFAGGSLSPFSGERGLIYSILLEAVAQGRARFSFGPNSYVYLANGKGTKVEPERKDLDVVVREGVDGLESNLDALFRNDQEPPTMEHVSLEVDPINPSQKLLSFAVKDDSSGVKSVDWRSMRWAWWGSWNRAINPTAVQTAVWAVQLRASDNSGNVSEQIVYDWPAFFAYLTGLIAGVLTLIFIVINKIFRRKRYNYK